MATLENELLRINITLHGGNMTSIYDKVKHEELLWQGSDAWKDSDYVIFPWAGSLRDDYYYDEGIKYEMPPHGFALFSDFTILEQSNTNLTIGITDNEKTLKMYPYSFDFQVNYTLNNARLDVSYKIMNKNNKVMPFVFGSHPGINIPVENGDTKGSFIEFDKQQNFTKYKLIGVFIDKKSNIGEMKSFETTKKFFQDNLTFIIDYNGVGFSLVRSDGRKIHFNSTSPYMAFWSNPNDGAFVCVESWWGLPDEYNCIRELKDKKYIQKLQANGTYEGHYYLEIVK